MHRFQAAPACPFSEATRHRSKRAARPHSGSRDSLVRRQEHLARIRTAPERRGFFSLCFLAGAVARGAGGISQSAPIVQRFAKRDGFKCVWTTSVSDAGVSRGSCFLFFLPEARLPPCGLLAWRRGNGLDLLLLGFLDFPIAFLLALSHVALLALFDTDGMPMSCSRCSSIRRPHRIATVQRRCLTRGTQGEGSARSSAFT